ncbi:MAG TPA: malectin domain-containing carbohydrate-binding protein [Bryobacteraceae bacterium]|jgi:hypothetical protein|nr:malectin domain-containing carbohydrate-binding protein [Bryobacteraceae bacterium]
MKRFYLNHALAKFLAAGSLLAMSLVAASAQTVNINCGGSAMTASDGTQWSADEYFIGGDLLYTGYSIAGAQPTDYYLYRSARAGLYGDFTYSIPVPNGTYNVKLLFAEIQYTGQGQRVFNVAINGATVLSNFDILAHVAPLTPLPEQFTATVTNGTLNLSFTGVTRRALVNAIQVSPASGSSVSTPSGGTSTGGTPPSGTPALAISVSTLSFSATAGGGNPAAQSVSVSNSGSGTMSWTASSNQSWLSVSPASGSNAGTLAVAVSTGALAAGTYSGAVTVNAGSAGSKTVSVSVSVAAAPSAGNPPPVSSGNSWYVTTSGSASGNGTMASPWDLATALSGAGGRIKPGDTVWIRAGKYGAGQSNSSISASLVGTASAPIIVRAYPGERVTIDEWLEVGCCDGAINPSAGSYTWFWGLEFAGFNTDRSTGTSGPPSYGAGHNHNAVDIWAPGTKLINCIVHDTGGGVSVWSAAGTELTGNIVYNVGGYGPDRGHGHDFYLQNQAPNYVTLNDNIGFDSFDMGLHAYGSDPGPYVQNLNLTGNVIFNSGQPDGSATDNLCIGGGTGGPTGIKLDSNYFYFPPANNAGYNELGYLWDAKAGSAVVTNNFFIGGANGIDLERWQSLTFQNNTIYSVGTESMLLLNGGDNPSSYQDSGNRYFGSGRFSVYNNCVGWPCNGSSMTFANWQATEGLDQSSAFSSAPTGVQTFVRPNAYEPGRANIIVFNWSMNGSVSVDLSSSGIKAGDPFQIRDAENWYHGPIVTGTYSGAPVTIPMAGLTIAQPNGSVPAPAVHTAPEFGVFVLLSGKALANTY